MSDTEHMIKMANQIAENFSFYDDQVARTADHLQRFWAARMRSKIAHHLQSGGAGLSEPAREAIRMLES